MENDYKYTDVNYQALQHAYDKSIQVKYGSPDQYQFHQNNLSKAIALFLLKHYENRKY